METRLSKHVVRSGMTIAELKLKPKINRKNHFMEHLPHLSFSVN